MRLRIAKAEDVSHINALTSRAVETFHVDYYSSSEITTAVRLAYGVDWQLIRDETYFVAEVDGVIAGAGGWSFRQTIGGRHGPDEPASPPLDPMHDAARVRAFFVDPAYARRGTGSQLLSVCEDAARNASFARVELVSTLQAVPFYSAHGYRVVRPFDLPVAEDFMLRTQLMRKEL